MMIDEQAAAGVPQWTPADLVRAGEALLFVSCEACRVQRGVSAPQLIANGYGDRPIAELVFRCHKCRAIGRATVAWRNPYNAHRSYYWPRPVRPERPARAEATTANSAAESAPIATQKR